MTPSTIPIRDRLLTHWWQRGWRGYRTLRRLLPSGQTNCAVWYSTPYGSCFLLDPLSYIDGFVTREGFYESEVLEAIITHLSAGSVLWDIGANFGLHAVTAACLVPGATVVAFEPNPIEHARLLQHRAWNAPHLITSTLALSDRAGVLPLHLGPPGNSGMTTLGAWARETENGTVNVAVATGDDLIARGIFPSPTAIKLDVEGFEAGVLRGLAATLALPHCELVVFEDGPSPDSEPKRILQNAGFIISPLKRRENTEHALANFAARRPSSA